MWSGLLMGFWMVASAWAGDVELSDDEADDWLTGRPMLTVPLDDAEQAAWDAAEARRERIGGRRVANEAQRALLSEKGLPIVLRGEFVGPYPPASVGLDEAGMEAWSATVPALRRSRAVGVVGTGVVVAATAGTMIYGFQYLVSNLFCSSPTNCGLPAGPLYVGVAALGVGFTGELVGLAGIQRVYRDRARLLAPHTAGVARERRARPSVSLAPRVSPQGGGLALAGRF